MPIRAPRILVFDSGVGGLSIVSEIRALLPGIGIDYLADNAFFPYGTKAEAELKLRVLHVIDAAIRRLHPTLIVIGCNSASTIALDDLRAHFTLPFVGVVPAIKPAAQHSRSKTIGLLATEGTIMRDYTRRLAREFAHDCVLVNYGSSELVLQAEKLVRGEPPERDRIAHELAQLWAQPGAASMDAVVLGCTHFPLLQPLLAELAPARVDWIDSGAAIARRVRTLLGDAATTIHNDSHDSHNDNHNDSHHDSAWFTAPHDQAIGSGLCRFGINRCTLLRV